LEKQAENLEKLAEKLEKVGRFQYRDSMFAYPHRVLGFATQNDKRDLFVRTIGIARATIKIGMAELVFSPVGTARSAEAARFP
jgi:hypothetical protein